MKIFGWHGLGVDIGSVFWGLFTKKWWDIPQKWEPVQHMDLASMILGWGWQETWNLLTQKKWGILMNFSKTNGGLKPTEWGVFCTRNHGELTIWNKSHGNSSYNDAEIERTFSPWNQFSQTRNPIINVGFSSQQGGILPWIHCYIYIYAYSCIHIVIFERFWKQYLDSTNLKRD